MQFLTWIQDPQGSGGVMPERRNEMNRLKSRLVVAGLSTIIMGISALIG